MEDEYEEIYRIYEYDLTDFTKVKYTNLKYGDDFSEECINNGTFGKYKDGFYFIKPKYDNEGKFYNYEIYLKNELYTMDSTEKFDVNT